MEVRHRNTIALLMRVRNPTVRSMAETRNTQNRRLIQGSDCGITVKRFSRRPGSSACMVGKLVQAWVPYHASQSGCSNQRVAITDVPYAMRNNAIGVRDCSAKKNLFHAAVKDLMITASPRASRHSRRVHADHRARADTSLTNFVL